MENENNVSYQEASYPSEDPNKSVMSMGEWFITLIVMMIPCVNIIMMIIWSFGNGNENRKNYCRANLIITVVGTVLAVIVYATVLAGALASLGNYY
ncbi:MAG: hypothetical protein QM683_04475 [Lacrimispora sp.]